MIINDMAADVLLKKNRIFVSMLQPGWAKTGHIALQNYI